MKKDIDFPKVTGVKLAIVKEVVQGETQWSLYILNLNLIELSTILINSKGYGEIDGEQKKTSTLRHVIKELGPQEFARVEHLDPAVFALTNEFWVSYYIMDQIFDKKFIFTPGSFDSSQIRMIPELGMEGVLHS
ncbi:hypothetical protein ACFOSV_17270 [Algoriphagus namhaensis]|uniref:Uncharacterized protein n=1 Tax=Algoriphagus namhaensis TaxID=915353 RepID=A0ABV8AWB4_9BACT